jgi:peptide/nickel transport system substrate-binding protein
MFTSAIAPQYRNLDYTYNPAKAKSILKADGWKMGSDGYLEKNGKEFSFSVIYVTSETNVGADVLVMAAELKAIGIKMTIDGLSTNSLLTTDGLGNFQAEAGYPVAPAPTIFSVYQEMMSPQFYEPVGKNDPSFEDMERFNDPTAKKLFEEYDNASAARRQQILTQLEGIWATDLPFIVLVYWADSTEWSTRQVTGFATQSNPYFMPNPNEVVALRLRAA